MKTTCLLALLGAAALAQPPAGVPVIDLASALQRARQYAPEFLAAQTASGLAREDRIQAKAALFPTVTALNQMIYTQGNGTDSGRFVSNDGVHVYNEQAQVHAEVFSFAKRADYTRTQAAEAAARARQDVAARGLSSTVALNYYGVVIAQRHEANAQHSVEEAARFLEITEKQERGGEVARADVIKARLGYQQRQREVADAQTLTQRTRLALGVLLWPDPTQPYSVTDDLKADETLPPDAEVRDLATATNPEVRAAQSTVKQTEAGVSLARAEYYPTFAIDYFYGINANVFGIHGPEDRQNLGSVVQGTLTVPVWNWGATRSKVRQAELERQLALSELTFTQRALQSSLSSSYLEARTARTQLESLNGTLGLSEESLRLTLLRYQAGEATALEVVDAQATLLQARNAYDDGLARYRLALATLQILTGRL
jgi:outer membrane protein TolC